MISFDTKKYLQLMFEDLLNNSVGHKIELKRAWASDFPAFPGVYIFKDNSKIIYVGETVNLRGRMKDMIDTRNHVLRRNIGNELYRGVEGFEPATARKKFNEVIEDMLNKHITRNLTVSWIKVELGRKELEERFKVNLSLNTIKRDLERPFKSLFKLNEATKEVDGL